MSQDELQQLSEEAEAAEAAPPKPTRRRRGAKRRRGARPSGRVHLSVPTPADPEMPEDTSADDAAAALEQMGAVFGKIVGAIGKALTRRAGVSDLDATEVSEIGNAAAGVAALYGTVLSPQAMAWGALTIAIGAPVLQRLDEFEALAKERAKQLAKPEPTADAPHADALARAT